MKPQSSAREPRGARWVVAHPTITLDGQPMYSAHPKKFPNIYPVDWTTLQSFVHCYYELCVLITFRRLVLFSPTDEHTKRYRPDIDRKRYRVCPPNEKIFPALLAAIDWIDVCGSVKGLLRFVHSTWTELNWTGCATSRPNYTTRSLIGCSETGTVGAQLVGTCAMNIPIG